MLRHFSDRINKFQFRLSTYFLGMLFMLLLSSCKKTPNAVNVVNETTGENVLPEPEEKLSEFPFLKFDSVIAYAYNGRGHQEDNQIITVYKSELNHTAELPGVKLSGDQATRILDILNDTLTYRGYTAGCFDPRMGLVFYVKDKVIAYVSICFECNWLRASPDIDALERSGDSGFRGFGKEGRNKLKAFCSELGLNYCDAESPLFDK